MSHAFITRRGGKKAFAVIGAEYPEGSICTCSDGTKTLTARGTSGNAIFYIPSSGTWTVNCEGKSKEISITEKGQVESVNLNKTYVYNKGDAPFGEFVDNNISYNGGDLTLDATSMKWTGKSTDMGSAAKVCPSDKITVSGNTLYFNIQNGTSVSGGTMCVGIFTDKNDKNMAASTDIKPIVSNELVSVDVTAFIGADYYIGWYSSNCTKVFEVNEIYFE